MKFNSTILKSNASRLFVIVLFSFSAISAIFSQTGGFSVNQSPLPAPTSPVMDYAGVLDAATKSNLEKRIIELRDKTNPKVELAVAIVQTTDDRPIFDYSLAVARGWGIGSKETDNPSALLFVAINDRKYFTQVSKDLEDELPDGVVGQLQRQNLVPAFRQGNYSKGINDTIEAYISTIEAKQSGQPMPAQSTAQKRESRSSFGGFVICLIIIFIILIIIFSRGKGGGGGGNNDRWRGGGFGGGGGALPFIVGTILGNALGSGGRSSSGGWGGGSGGGGSDWGGFGGGGDFGGGGAGGDW